MRQSDRYYSGLRLGAGQHIEHTIAGDHVGMQSDLAGSDDCFQSFHRNGGQDGDELPFAAR